MATVKHEDDDTLSLELGEGRVLVNGRAAGAPCKLQHFDRIIFGHVTCLRVVKRSNF